MDDLQFEKNIAVIGSGYWGKNIVRNFYNLGALHTACEANPDTLAAILEKFPGVEGAADYKAVLSNPDIKGVAIATPAATHASMVQAALLAGKDVFVEKPLCLDNQEGAELVKLAKAKGRILMVGHLLWYHPAVLTLKEMIHNGELGRVHYIYSNRLNLGKLRREENVLWSFAPHDVSVILGLMEDFPESVMAQGGSFLNGDVADTTVSMLNFKGGARAHIFVSWLHPFKEQKLVVVGDHKMAVFDDTLPWEDKLLLYPHTIEWHGNIPVPSKAEAKAVDVKQDEPLKKECAHFLECMISRATPRTDGEEGVRVLRVLNACQKAMESSRQTWLAEDNSDDIFIHESAVIDKRVDIGKRTKVWHFSHVLSDSTIGEDCVIGQNVMIGPKVNVGSNCRIQNNVSLYKGVNLDDDVFCGPSMVFTNVINPRAFVSRKEEFMETPVGRGATIGANATVVCGNRIGKYSMVGAGAVVTHDVPDYALVVGNPARLMGWMCMCGVRLKEESLNCDSCGRIYERTDTGIAPIEAMETTEAR